MRSSSPNKSPNPASVFEFDPNTNMASSATPQSDCEQRIQFGKPLLEAFCLDPEYTNLNARKFPFRKYLFADQNSQHLVVRGQKLSVISSRLSGKDSKLNQTCSRN
jgi:hypothetical protein